MPSRNLSAQGVQVLATPSVNRRKDVFGVPSRFSHTFNAAPEPEGIPESSAINAVSCTPNAKGGSTSRAVQQLPASHQQTPTRGLLKPTGSWSNVSSTGNRPELGCRLSKPSSNVDAVVPFLDEKNASQPHSFPSLPSSRNRTPTKVGSTNTQPQTSHWKIDDTPIKVPQAPLGRKQEKSISPNTNENSVSIYDSLGWNDDVDELS